MERINEIKIRLSDDELNSLKSKISLTALSREEFCRQVLAGSTIKTILKEDSLVLLSEIRRISISLKKLAFMHHSIDSNLLRYEIAKLKEIEKRLTSMVEYKELYMSPAKNRKTNKMIVFQRNELEEFFPKNLSEEELKAIILAMLEQKSNANNQYTLHEDSYE